MKRRWVRSLVAGMIAFCLANAINGQTRNRQSSMTRLIANKPTVYVTFRGVVSEVKGTAPDEQRFRLELHNNTKWTLSCYLVPQPISPGDSAVMYQAEAVDGGRVIHRSTSDVLIPKPVESGMSVSFSVPSAHLGKGYQIFVEFIYEWEKRDDISPYGLEQSHRVYFSNSDLLDNLRNQE